MLFVKLGPKYTAYFCLKLHVIDLKSYLNSAMIVSIQCTFKRVTKSTKHCDR